MNAERLLEMRIHAKASGLHWPQALELFDEIERLRGLISGSVEVLQFLYGAAPIDGQWYGDERRPGQAPFWWRNNLRPLVDAALKLSTP